jgi:hypothetical protein
MIRALNIYSVIHNLNTLYIQFQHNNFFMNFKV